MSLYSVFLTKKIIDDIINSARNQSMKKEAYMEAPFLREIYLQDLNFISDDFPFDLPFIKNNNFHIKIHSPVTIIAGDNGSGKSTILKSIATSCGFNLNSGNKDHICDLNNDKFTALNKHLKYLWNIRISNGFFLRSDNFIHFANFLDEQAKEHGPRVFKYYGGKSLNEQSHGEAYLSLFSNRFSQKGIYILDEPEVALSPSKILSLMSIIKDLSNEGKSQFIIATHSPILMAYPFAQFFYIDDTGIKETTFDKAEHYIITKSFLDNPERYFKYLFDDENENR